MHLCVSYRATYTALVVLLGLFGCEGDQAPQCRSSDGCGDDVVGPVGDGGTGGQQEGSGGRAGDGDGDGDLPGDGDGDGDTRGDGDGDGDGEDLTCGVQTSQATLQEARPVDVIFVIDNSGSMSQEMAGVRRNINDNFASIIEASGADYRVILITRFGTGSGTQICIDPPLSLASCAGATAPINGGRFFHYNLDVYSLDSVCKLIDSFNGAAPDVSGQALLGWQEWLRPGSLKVFVEVSDDRVGCSTLVGGPALGASFQSLNTGNIQADASNLALRIMDALMAMSPTHFVADGEPNFVWHSIIGLPDNDPVSAAYTSLDGPQLDGQCVGARNAPTYQMMSIFSGGLRYPVCQAVDQGGEGYDPVFRAIANQVVRGSGVDCVFPIPAAPEGKFVDLDTILVEYTPGAGGALQTFGRVTEDSCDARSFFIDRGGIRLCDDTCTYVRGDAQAAIRVVFECGEEGPLLQ